MLKYCRINYQIWKKESVMRIFCGVCEYCKCIEPPVRRNEPLNARNRASYCEQESRPTIFIYRTNLLYNEVACLRAWRIITGGFFMIQYRKILELHFNAISQRTISTSVGSSRNTVSDVVKRAKNLGLERLTDTMTNQLLASLPREASNWERIFPTRLGKGS